MSYALSLDGTPARLWIRERACEFGAVWIRPPVELHMKRLLGLLLVMGMVGCGADGLCRQPLAC